MNVEHIATGIYSDDREACAAVARRIERVIRNCNEQSRPAVLGLATGHTPINVYRELIRFHREEDLDFSRVITFNLDEYWPIRKSAIQSYHNWMNENLFKRINIPEENVHLPDGEIPD